MIRAGSLRHVVRFEKRSTVQDGAGEPLDTWTLVVERMAALERAPGREVWASAGNNARVPTVFRLRYDRDLMSAYPSIEMRLLFDGRVYEVSSMFDPDGLKHELTVTAIERVQEAP